jgi:hypothetical protein
MLGSSLGVEGVSVVLRVKVPFELVCGDVDEGYGAVADAFRRNFARGEEIGAACAIYQDGRAVVDLRGGYRDGQVRSLWEADTMVSVFSATKGMAGAAMAVAHARGLFDLDEQVASYWPEFGTNGGTGEPRTIARVYGALAHRQYLSGVTAPTMSELEQPACAPTSGPRDVALGLNASYAMGFLKPCMSPLRPVAARHPLVDASVPLSVWRLVVDHRRVDVRRHQAVSSDKSRHTGEVHLEPVLGVQGDDRVDVVRVRFQDLRELLEEVLETRRRDDLQEPCRLIGRVPEGVPDVARLVDEVAGSCMDDLVTQLEPPGPFEHERVLVLARVQVHRRGEAPRDDRVFDERKPILGDLPIHDETSSDATEIAGDGVSGADDRCPEAEVSERHRCSRLRPRDRLPARSQRRTTHHPPDGPKRLPVYELLSAQAPPWVIAVRSVERDLHQEPSRGNVVYVC